MSYSNDHSRVLQPDSKLFAESVPGKSAVKSGKVGGKLRFCLRFAAFVFSHVGLGFLVLVYTVLGAFIFKHFEESTVSHSITHIADIRNSTVNKLWTETYKLNVLYKENWTAMAIKEIEQFQRVLVKALKEGYTPGEENANKVHSRWSFTDSWMYSISIITTIGYANRPSTSEGKIATVIFALFGIPIMLLFLSTIGNLLGQGLKSLYSFCCGCSSESHRSLVNAHGHEHDHHHHHHHFEDYQTSIHHIPLTNLNGTAHLVPCQPPNHTYPAKNVPVLNTPFHPRCSYEADFAELEAETKLCADSVDHLCADSGPHSAVSHPHCKYLATGLESFFKEEPGKGSSHCQPASSSGFEEPSCETVPFYFCFLLIVLYMLCGAFMFHVWEGCSIMDGAYFTFVTLSTIGPIGRFGEIIPEKTLSSANQTESKKRIILIVLYILGGMTLIAMSFNIIYEQLAIKFRNIGTRFQLRSERSHSGNGRDIKIVTNNFINCAEDIDV